MNFNEEMNYELTPLRLEWRCEQNEKMHLQSRINAQKTILGD